VSAATRSLHPDPVRRRKREARNIFLSLQRNCKVDYLSNSRLLLLSRAKTVIETLSRVVGYVKKSTKSGGEAVWRSLERTRKKIFGPRTQRSGLVIIMYAVVLQHCIAGLHGSWQL
jgi:hypothetical protein